MISQFAVFSRRAAIAAGLALLALAGVAPADAQQWPARPITIIVPTEPGGSLDRMARLIAPPLGAELGQPVNISNRPGGNSLLGHAVLLTLPDDGYNVVMSAAAPQLVTQVDMGLAQFKTEDFAFLNAQWVDWGAFMVPNDKPYKSWPEFVAAIKANPGKLIVVTIPNTERHVILLRLLEIAGLKVSDIRLVTYNGGGELRTAMLNGQTDLAVTTLEGSDTVADKVHTIMVIKPERHKDYPNAPTIVEVMGKDMDKVPLLSGSVRTLATQASFKQKYPDRWNKLLTAYKAALEKPDVQKQFAAQQIGAEWVGPELTTKLIVDYGKTMSPFLKLLQDQKK